MATEASPPASPERPSTVFFYPIVGFLAVGNLVFALLWLLSPIASGPASDRGGRRVEARAGDRVLRITEGLGTKGVTAGYDGSLPTEPFEKLAQMVAEIAKPLHGEIAKEYFESPAGREAQPAVSIVFPTRKGAETLEAYALDVGRRLCYCRLGSTKEPLAVKADKYEQATGELSQLLGSAAGSLSLPFYVPIGEALVAKLSKLETPLHVTTVSANPLQTFTALIDGILRNPMAAAGAIQFTQPDPATLTATVQLPEDLAMARGLAESMARASSKVTARHLDVSTQAAALREFARSAKRSVAELADSLVLQHGDRVRVIKSGDLGGREEGARFEGDQVVAKALDDLLSQRGLVYFAEGFGERRIADDKAFGLRQVGEQIAARGFQVASLDFSATKSIPADCSVLVIPGPKNAYPGEVNDALARHVEKGGRLAVFLDPTARSPVLVELLGRYGLSIPDATRVFSSDPREPRAIPVVISRRVDFARRWPQDPLLFLTLWEVGVRPAPQGSPFEVVRLGSIAVPEGEEAAPCALAAVRPAGAARGPKLLVCGGVDAFTNQIVRQVPTNGALLAAALTWLAE